jgi:hypothetical protein
MDKQNQELAKYENNKILEIIQSVPNLSDQEKKELTLKVLSDDAEIRKLVMEKLAVSQIAIGDLITVQSEITALNKQGMYIKAKQTIKTGSGHVEIEMKGGDAKLIIPVLVILGIIIIAALVIVFWK